MQTYSIRCECVSLCHIRFTSYNIDRVVHGNTVFTLPSAAMHCNIICYILSLSKCTRHYNPCVTSQSLQPSQNNPISMTHTHKTRFPHKIHMFTSILMLFGFFHFCFRVLLCFHFKCKWQLSDTFKVHCFSQQMVWPWSNFDVSVHVVLFLNDDDDDASHTHSGIT